jgi:ArsR family transcriptional regulator
MYVCELEKVLQMSQPRISQHLRVMKHAGLVKERKEAQRTFYALRIDYLDEQFKELLEFFHADLESLPLFTEECQRFKELEEDCGVAQCKEGKIEAANFKQEA